MKVPDRRRTNPKHRKTGPAPSGADLRSVADRVRYIGSPVHKDLPSFAGPVPRHRPDASVCPRDLAQAQSQIQEWLQSAILKGQFGELWEGDGFPRYVWHKQGGVIYEARLINAQLGEYKGYPLESSETVRGLA